MLATLSIGHAAAATGPLPNIEDFEGTVPLSSGNPGIFGFGSDAASTPKLSVVAAPTGPARQRQPRPRRTVHRAGYGGFSDDLAAAQDWRSYGGFSFWYKGTGSGQKVEYEIKDGGADAEHSELWQGFFTDSTAAGTRSTSRSPASSSAPTTSHRRPERRCARPRLDVGLCDQPAGNASGHLQFDDFAVYGHASPRWQQRSDYLVDPGQTAQVGVTVSTPDGIRAQRPGYRQLHLGRRYRAAGTDFPATSGTLTFPAGTPSGTVQDIAVRTTAGTPAAEAKTIPVKLTATGATLSGAAPRWCINAHGLPYLNSTLPIASGSPTCSPG